jgi:hypothetical protein
MQPPVSSGAGNYNDQIRALLDAGVPATLIRAIGPEAAAKTLKGAGDAQTFLSTFAKDLPAGRLVLLVGCFLQLSPQ